MIENTISWALLGRYITNEATPDERRAVTDWLADSEANQLTFQSVRQRYDAPDALTPLPEESDSGAVWDRYITPHLSDGAAVRPLPVRQTVWGQPANRWRVAGLVLLAGLMGVLYQ